jgi:hypothetical protein
LPAASPPGWEACLGNEESAGVNYSHRCTKGNHQMRRVLNQAANRRGQDQKTLFLHACHPLVGDRAAFFGGLDVDETAEALHVSPRTVMRDWSLPRAWLSRELTISRLR